MHKKLFTAVTALTLFLTPSFVFADTATVDTTSGTSAQDGGFGHVVGAGPFCRIQKFQIPVDGTIDSITTEIKKDGSPSDDVVLSLYDDLTTSALSSVTVTNSNFTTSYASTVFTFSSPVSVLGNTDLYFVLRRSGAANNTNNWDVLERSPKVYTYSAGSNNGANDCDSENDHNATFDSIITYSYTPTPTPSTATTTTINDPNRDYFNLIVLFWVGFFTIVWLFKRK